MKSQFCSSFFFAVVKSNPKTFLWSSWINTTIGKGQEWLIIESFSNMKITLMTPSNTKTIIGSKISSMKSRATTSTMMKSSRNRLRIWQSQNKFTLNIKVCSIRHISWAVSMNNWIGKTLIFCLQTQLNVDGKKSQIDFKHNSHRRNRISNNLKYHTSLGVEKKCYLTWNNVEC